jgi:orotidine-5'-phosphate decarboxylase
LDVQYLTLFTNEAQIRAAAEVVAHHGSGLKLLNVTVLTSQASTFAEVDARAKMSLAAGAHGLICSGLEAAELRRVHGTEAILVTPGIRPGSGEKVLTPTAQSLQSRADDQVRIVTPGDAIRAGATNLVVWAPDHAGDKPARSGAGDSR